MNDELIFNAETHIYMLNGQMIPSVTQVLECVGLLDTQWFTDYHRWRGSAVHMACHYLDEGALDWNTVQSEYSGHVAAYSQFKKDTGFEPEMIEKPLYCPTWRFAGTPDRVGLLNGRRAVIDLKNVSSAPAYQLQTAGYAWLAGPRQALRFTLHLKPDGAYKLQKHDNADDVQDFFAALRITHWKMRALKWKPQLQE